MGSFGAPSNLDGPVMEGKDMPHIETEDRNIPIMAVMTAIFCGLFLAMLGISSISVAIPVLMKEFHTNLAAVQWTMTGFMLATGVVAPITGYLVDKYSAKYLFVTGLVGYTVMSGMCAFAWNIESLITFRMVQGIFSGIVIPVTMTILYQIIPREKQAFALSMWTLSTMLAPTFGPTLAGLMIEMFSWRWLFLIDVPLGLASVAVAWRLIPYYKLSTPKTFDLPGLITVILCSASLLVACSEANVWGWGSWRTISLFAFGLMMLGCFIRRELRVNEPLLNLRVFVNLKFTVSVAVAVVITVSLFSGAFLTPLFLQDIQRISALDAGLLMLPPSLAMAMMMPVIGRLYTRVSPQLLIVSGILLIAVGTFALGRIEVQVSHGYLVLWMTVRNIGISLSIMPITSFGMEAIPRELSGHASSVNNWIRQAFGSFSIALFTSLLASRIITHSQALGLDGAVDEQRELLEAKAFTMSSNDVYLVAAIVVLAALPLLFLLKISKFQEKAVVIKKLQQM
jgi:EmrB/QacA subfamily drug resistance transporter